MNNLFEYAPKELSTDAFLAWLFRAFSEDSCLEDKASKFFNDLGLCSEPHKEIDDVSVNKQEGHTDLIVRCLINGKPAQFLFENKIYSSIHSGQLKRYKDEFEGFDGYFYLKLGYISYAERQEADEHKYEVIDAEALYQALEPLLDCHFLVGHYAEFLHQKFLLPLREIRKGLTPKSFKSGQAQQHFLSVLHESLSGCLTGLKFSASANIGGSPWTQLTIAARLLAYGNNPESLFWRIDKGRKGHYLRLTQYSNVDKKYENFKKVNLKLLRQRLENIPLLSELAAGKVRNGGLKSSEVFVFYFDDNDVNKMLEILPGLSLEISRLFGSIVN